MFERFTDRARETVILAQREARALNHNYIGTEHILLGLIRESGTVAGRVLAGLGVTMDAAQREIEAIVGRGKVESPQGHIPFSPRAKKVLELSLREALQLGHNYIGPEHILLALIRQGETEGVAVHVLISLDVDFKELRNRVMEVLVEFLRDQTEGLIDYRLVLRDLYRTVRDDEWKDEQGKKGVLTGIVLSLAKLDKSGEIGSSKESIHVWLNSDKH